MARIYWASILFPSDEIIKALRKTHGEDVEIKVLDALEYPVEERIIKLIDQYQDGIVYPDLLGPDSLKKLEASGKTFGIILEFQGFYGGKTKIAYIVNNKIDYGYYFDPNQTMKENFERWAKLIEHDRAKRGI